MGFSTSGAVAIILIGLFVAASVIVPTAFSITSATSDAFASQSDQIREQKNTEIGIQSVEDVDGDLEIRVANNGTETLELRQTNVLVDGVFIAHDDRNTSVLAGDTERNETRLWPPGTQFKTVVNESVLADDVPGVTNASDVERVKIATENGIADGTTFNASTTEETD